MVRAETLTPEHLLAAMQQGDFYATTGVMLKTLDFDQTILHVTVQAEEGVNYRIQFITTKGDFDQRMTTVSRPAKNGQPARTIPMYADEHQ